MNGAAPVSVPEPGTVRQLLATVAGRLRSVPEARWIVAHVADIAPSELLTRLDTPVSATAADAARAMAARRMAGEPLQYVIGRWSFRRLELTVDARALVPRPETEQVVEVALGELRRLPPVTGAGGVSAAPVVADLGTGSGVIALSLALEAIGTRPAGRGGPGAAALVGEVWATDVSPSALALARVNLSALAVSHPGPAARVRLAVGSWFCALPGRLAGHVHLVVSNPPYVSAAEWDTLDHEVRDHEPRSALVPGDSGLEALTLLVDQARRWLAPGGSLVVELAPRQAPVMEEEARRAGYAEVEVRVDLSGRSRILVARWSGG